MTFTGFPDPSAVPATSRGAWLKSAILPVVAALAVFGASYALYHFLHEQENRLVYRIVGSDTERLGSRVRERLQDRLERIEQLAQRWSQNPGMADSLRREDVTELMNQDLDFRAVEWRDTSLAVRWSGPLEAKLPRGVLDPGDDAIRHDEIVGIVGRAKAMISRSYLANVSGQRQILFYVPVSNARGPVGSVVAVARARDIFDGLFEDRFEVGYVVSVFEGFLQLYGPLWTDGGDEVTWMNETSTLSGDLGIKIQMWPSPELLKEFQSIAHILLLVWGGILALFTGFAIHRLRRRGAR